MNKRTLWLIASSLTGLVALALLGCTIWVVVLSLFGSACPHGPDPLFCGGVTGRYYEPDAAAEVATVACAGCICSALAAALFFAASRVPSRMRGAWRSGVWVALVLALIAISRCVAVSY